MVSEPLRGGPVLAATEYDTLPSPEPLAAEVIDTQLRSSVAVHAHSLPVVTLTVNVAASAPADRASGEIE
jgi:hypothetical protein